MRTADLLLLGASQVVTLDDGVPGPKAGRAAMNDLGVVEDGAVAIHRGRIVDVGTSKEVTGRWRAWRRVFCRGRAVVPGLVDAHTHPVFAAMRAEEFASRCRGATYEEILAAGGGIHASAARLAETPVDVLATDVRRRLDRFLLHGTTTVEGKSGYGLSTANEIKSLIALRRGARGHPVRVVPTFLG
ncbi:MAG: imidazolonepropionase, partial [Planctomycetota bacterium]